MYWKQHKKETGDGIDNVRRESFATLPEETRRIYVRQVLSAVFSIHEHSNSLFQGGDGISNSHSGPVSLKGNKFFVNVRENCST